jgi:hypothetical protein
MSGNDGQLPHRFKESVTESKNLTAKFHPLLSVRLEQREAAHHQLELKLEGGLSLQDFDTPQAINDFVFESILTITEAHLPQRTGTYSGLKFGVPPPITSNNEDPFWLYLRKDRGTFHISQIGPRPNKVGKSDPCGELAPELTHVINGVIEWLKELRTSRGVDDTPDAFHGIPVFPSSLLKHFSKKGFEEFEKRGWKSLCLVGATVNNHRHSLADWLCMNNITPEKNLQLASSYASAMNTSISKLFGSRIPVSRESEIGRGYNKRASDPTVRRFSAHQHMRNHVFKKPTDGLFMIEFAPARHAAASIMTNDVLTQTTLLALHHRDDASGVYQQPCLDDKADAFLVLPRAVSTVAPLIGVNQGTWDSEHCGWKIATARSLDHLRAKASSAMAQHRKGKGASAVMKAHMLHIPNPLQYDEPSPSLTMYGHTQGRICKR